MGVRLESQARTRELLIAAAREEVARCGTSASVRDIAEAAGFSQGALYANFGSKDRLLLELMTRHCEEEARSLKALLEEAQDGDAALRRLDAWAETLSDNADWSVVALELQLFQARAPSLAREFAKVREAYREALGEVVARLFWLHGRSPTRQPADIAAGLMALANGLLVESGECRERAGRTVMAFVRGLLGASEPID